MLGGFFCEKVDILIHFGKETVKTEEAILQSNKYQLNCVENTDETELGNMYTVLLVENKELACILQTYFAEECTLRMVRDTAALLCSLQTEPVDLVIVDLDTPESRTMEAVVSLQTFAQKGVVLFAADHTLFDPSHPLTVVSAVDYLLRPCTETEWILTLESALQICDQGKQSAETGEESLRLSFVREKIENYVRAHYSETLSMQTVAHAMNYSESHFCRLFKQCFKMTFSVYLNEYRIEQAKQLLVSTNSNIKEISLRSGYQDTSYFIRVFKRSTGMTPADYRIYAQSMSRK